VPGVAWDNDFLNHRVSYYWNKKAWREAPNDYTKARQFHFLHALWDNTESRVLESEKAPLENRVWYYYPGQLMPGYQRGTTIARPSVVARVLDDGSTQYSQYEYNAMGSLTHFTDPVGRETRYDYASNLIDLLAVRQTTGSINETLRQFTYNAR